MRQSRASQKWEEFVALELADVPSASVPAGAWTVMLWMWRQQGDVPTRQVIASRVGISPGTVSLWLSALADLGLLSRSGTHFSLNEPGVVKYLQDCGKAVAPRPGIPESSHARASSAVVVEERVTGSGDAKPIDESFVDEVVAMLKGFRLHVHADIVGPDLRQLRSEGMTVDLARAAARRTYKAATRRFDYFEATVRGMLSDQIQHALDRDDAKTDIPREPELMDMSEYRAWRRGGDA